MAKQLLLRSKDACGTPPLTPFCICHRLLVGSLLSPRFQAYAAAEEKEV